MAPPNGIRLTRIDDLLEAVELLAHLAHNLHMRLEELAEYELGNLEEQHEELDEPLTAVIHRIQAENKKKRKQRRRHNTAPADTKKRKPPRDDDNDPPAKRSSRNRVK